MTSGPTPRDGLRLLLDVPTDPGTGTAVLLWEGHERLSSAARTTSGRLQYNVRNDPPYARTGGSCGEDEVAAVTVVGGGSHVDEAFRLMLPLPPPPPLDLRRIVLLLLHEGERCSVLSMTAAPSVPSLASLTLAVESLE